MRPNFLTVVSIFLLVFSVNGPAKVASTTFAELVEVSDFIAVGQVAEVVEFEGWRIARFKQTDVLKGSTNEFIYYLADPTWTCDTVEAHPGEEALLFVSFPEEIEIESHNGRQPHPKIYDNQPIFRVSWSGRGRMPVSSIDHQKFATFWVGDIRLPNSIQTQSGPEPEYDFIRNAPLKDLISLVKEYQHVE